MDMRSVLIRFELDAWLKKNYFIQVIKLRYIGYSIGNVRKS